MSNSRFVSQNIGSIIITDDITLNGHILTANEGDLYFNGNCLNNMSGDVTIANLKITGNLNGQNLQLTSDSLLLNGSVIGTINTAGSVNSVIQTAENDYFGTPIPYFTNTLGNVITNTAWNYYPGSSPFGLGYTSGGLLATDDAGTIFYLGDDNIFLGNINNSTSCSIELVSNNNVQIILNATSGTTITGNVTVNNNVNIDINSNMTIGSTFIDNTYENFGIIRTDDIYCTRIRTSSTNGILVHDTLEMRGNINMVDNSIGATIGNLSVISDTIIGGNLSVPGDSSILSAFNLNAENGTFGNLKVTGNMTYENFTATNISTSSIFVYHPTSTSDQDPMGNSSFNLVGQGGGGAVVNIDFSTYATSDCPTARISMIDDGSFASTFNIMTKQSGSPNNGMVSRLCIEPVNGYVGINNNEPGYQLDVNGTMRVNGDTTMGNVNVNTINVNSATVSNLLITGSITTPIINIGQQGVYNITKEMSGTTFFINKNPNDNGGIHLPAPSPGLNFKFIQANPEQNWTSLSVAGQYVMIGQINVTGTVGSSYANTISPIYDVDFSPNAQIGDTINLISDGTYYYYSGNSFNIDGIQKQWE